MNKPSSSPSPSPSPLKLGGIQIDNLSFEAAVERIITIAREHRSQYIVTPNADHLVRLQEDPKFQEVYRGAALIVADGMPIVWASKWLGNPLPERITGADLLPRLCKEAAHSGLSVYFLGAAEGIAQIAAAKLTATYPSLKVAGWYSPPFGFEKESQECQRIIDQIHQCSPDIIFVGLGSPKQEFWIANNRHLINTGVLLGIGASIGFAAGTEKRAPLLMQKLGLEWLHRLLQDPRRLAIRYLKDFQFFLIVYRTWRVNKKNGE